MLYSRVVKRLIESGAGIDFQDNKGNTRLHQCILKNDVESVKLLTENGANQKLKNKNGWTPKDLALLLGRKMSLQYLTKSEIPWISFFDKGSLFIQFFTQNEFQKKMGFEYLNQPKFDDLATLQQAADLARNSQYKDNCPSIPDKDTYDWIVANNSTPIWKDFVIQWVNDDIGYGLFANRDLMKGEYVGEYLGKISGQSDITSCDYLYFYNNSDDPKQILYVDAENAGNHTRFINHSSNPNILNSTFYFDGLLHQLFFVKHAVPKGHQLTYNYGQFYWEGTKPPLNI